ncbi:MAG: TetR family transcriptional regulator [Hyphomicrobiales bacterium]|nr:TetR family transcriptional regulator [Hyphomicrobiales bacterium]
MTEPSNLRESLVEAAMRVAARQGWRGASLADVAAEAGVALTSLRPVFQSKPQILAAFTRIIDDRVLNALKPEDMAAAPRDRLFDILMTRFETLAPYKPAIQRILADERGDLGAAFAQAGPVAASQYWMLAAAGVPADGLGGAVRVKAMTAIYARVFRIWLDDSDPGMARTMAALDRQLRRAEGWAKRADAASGAAERFAAAMRSAMRSGRASRSPTSAGQPPVEPAPQAPPPPPSDAGGAPVVAS